MYWLKYTENNDITDEGFETLSKGNWKHLEVLSLSTYQNILDSNPIGDKAIQFL